MIWEELLTIIAVVGGAVALRQSLEGPLRSMRQDLESVKRDLESVKQGLEGVKRDLNKVVTKLAEVVTFLKNEHAADIETLQPSSPIELSKKGIEIAKEIGAQSIAERCAQYVVVDENATNYAIQEASFRFVTNDIFEYLQPEEEKIIDHAAYTRGIDKGVIMQVVGVIIRNLKIEQHTGSMKMKK